MPQQKKKYKLDTAEEVIGFPSTTSLERPSKDGADQAISDDDAEEEELEQLDAEVKELAHKLDQIRRAMPSVLRDKLDSLLVTMRPAFPDRQEEPAGQHQSRVGSLEKPTFSEEGLEKGHGAAPLVTAAGREEEEDEEERETVAQIALIKSKIAANVAAMPAVLKRMKLIIEKINKLDQYKGNIDCVFTKELAPDD
jgi:predicted transcriptional regulator